MLLTETNRLDDILSTKKPLYMAHVYYGDPNEEFSIKLIETLCKNDIDIIEFGIPFSDPTSDGPVFQRSCFRALNNGMTPLKAIDGISRLRKIGLNQPIVVTCYYNTIFNMGLEEFVSQIHAAGADAVLVPNLPIEENNLLETMCEQYNLRNLLMISLRTPVDRIRRIVSKANGFVYVTAVQGVTGVRNEIENQTLKLIRYMKQEYDIPILVGFGISRGSHAFRIVEAGSDGVITGSAISTLYENELENPQNALYKIAAFAKEIKSGCDGGYERRKSK